MDMQRYGKFRAFHIDLFHSSHSVKSSPEHQFVDFHNGSLIIFVRSSLTVLISQFVNMLLSSQVAIIRFKSFNTILETIMIILFLQTAYNFANSVLIAVLSIKLLNGIIFYCANAHTIHQNYFYTILFNNSSTYIPTSSKPLTLYESNS